MQESSGVRGDTSMSPHNVKGVKRKERSLPKGIYMKGRQFRIKTRDIVTGKMTVIYFKTVEEAVEAKEAERSKWAAHKQAKLAKPGEDIRAQNFAIYGNNLKLERDFVLHLYNMNEIFEVNNDFTLPDVRAFLYEDCTLALGIQVKVTSGPKKGENPWEFAHVLGYTGMPVICWCADMQDGWVFDGTVPDKRGKEGVNITLGGVNANLALSGKHPLSIDDLIEFLMSRSSFRALYRSEILWQCEVMGKYGCTVVNFRCELVS